MNDDSTLIISGGELNLSFADRYLRNHTFTRIISVDNGLSYVNQLGIIPDIIVGDFDTACNDLVNQYKAYPDIECYQLNPQKDATDTEVGVDLAIECDTNKVVLLGAMGGRFDHTLGNLQMLYKMLQHKLIGYLIDEHNKIYLINKEITITNEEQYGKYVSLVPFSEHVLNLTITGFKYPLCQYDLCYGSSLGISNEIVEEKGKISFDSGTLIVIESND